MCRSVRPRLTVYICQGSLQESPLLERHCTIENGEHRSSTSLHGEDPACWSKVWEWSAQVWGSKLFSGLFLCSVSCFVLGGAHRCRAHPKDGLCVLHSSGNDQPGVQTESYRHPHPAKWPGMTSTRGCSFTRLMAWVFHYQSCLMWKLYQQALQRSLLTWRCRIKPQSCLHITSHRLLHKWLIAALATIGT